MRKSCVNSVCELQTAACLNPISPVIQFSFENVFPFDISITVVETRSHARTANTVRSAHDVCVGFVGRASKTVCIAAVRAHRHHPVDPASLG